MLRSLSRAMVVSALVAAPAGAQFGGPPGGAPFQPSTLSGQTHLPNGASASNGLTRIDNQPGSNVVATPEPATVALVATGLLGVLGVARRKRNA